MTTMWTTTHRRRLSVLLGACATALLSPAAVADDDLVSRGRRVYEQVCVECHGRNGQGSGPRAERLGRKPRDFTLAAFKCRSTPTGSLPTDDDLMRVVTNGLPGTPMRSFARALDEEERFAVVAYIKTFSDRFAAGEQLTVVPIPEPPPRTPESITEGQAVYRLLKCWNCHGVSGRGDGPAAASLADQWGQPIQAYDFTRWKRFKCGGDERDLYRMMHTGMTGSPMPSFTAAFAFPSNGVGDLSTLTDLFGEETAEIERWLTTQPDATALKSMSAEARAELVERRTWALIHYLRSLVRGS